MPRRCAARMRERDYVELVAVALHAEFFPDHIGELVELDELKRVKVNPKNQRTSVEGIWSAGDCTDELYHQNNIAAGDGVKALEDGYFWLKSRSD